MARQLSECYEFGNFRFNPTERYLLHKGESIALTPKALDTLFALVRHSGHLVTKEELLQEVWQDAFVEEATVVQNISTLRKVLSRDGLDSRFIETVPKRGYRFIASVRTCNDERVSQPLSANLMAAMAPAVGNIGNGVGLRAESAIPGLEATEFPAAGFDSSNKAIERHHRALPWKGLSYAFVGLLALITVGVLAAKAMRQNQTPNNSLPSFEKMSLARITQTGNARNSAISPDGKYVAYVALDAGKQSLWIKQVSAPNDAQIVPPSDARYLGLTFSPDGSYVLFVTYAKGENKGVLSRIPVIGGIPQRITEDIDSPVTFSPDGKQIAFVRGYLTTHETALISANADGTNEQKLASRLFPVFFSAEGPAWSPDGAVIACGVRITDSLGISETVVGVEPVSRKELRLTEARWAEVGRLSWDKSGARIIMTASADLGTHQLWQIPWPSGCAHRITNDLTDYRGVSLATNVSTISTVAIEADSSIWVTSGSQYQASELIPTKNDGLQGIAWTPDSKLVFSSGAAGESDIWVINADGSLKKPLTSDNRRDFAPTVTRDGRFLLYSSALAGTPAKIWRANIDGSNPKQLTFGNDDRFPTCSFDGKWVFYSSFNHNEQQDTYAETLWKVPIDGGQSSLVVTEASSQPMVSPDGKLIAFRYQAAPDLPWSERVISSDTGETIQDLPVGPGRSFIKWAPDGHGLTYVETRDGVSNIWVLPLNGGTPKQITHFASGQIFRYAWSYDGKRLALVRGVRNGDVVLIRDFG